MKQETKSNKSKNKALKCLVAVVFAAIALTAFSSCAPIAGDTGGYGGGASPGGNTSPSGDSSSSGGKFFSIKILAENGRSAGSRATVMYEPVVTWKTEQGFRSAVKEFSVQVGNESPQTVSLGDSITSRGTYAVGSEVTVRYEAYGDVNFIASDGSTTTRTEVIASETKIVIVAAQGTTVNFKVSDGLQTPENFPGESTRPEPVPNHVTYDWGEASRHGNKNGLPSDPTTYNEGDLFTVEDGSGMTWDHAAQQSGFAGWSASPAIEPANGGQATNAPIPGGDYKMPAGGVVLTAQWNKKTYQITYDENEPEDAQGNKATVTGVPQQATSVTALDDATAAASPTITNPFDSKNWTFLKWNTQENGLGDDYDAGDPIHQVTDNINLYAKWSDKDVWTVTYYKGSTQAAEQDITGWKGSDNVENGESVTLPTLQATGYTFTGWQINGATQQGGTSYTPTGNVDATAQWTPITYNIRLNTTNSNWSSVAGQISGQATVTATYDSAATLTAITPPSNYTFAGWAKADGATSAASNITQSGGSYTATNLANTQGTTVDLYPVWTPIPYNITYSNKNGGTGSADTTNATTSFTIETSPITFASEGTLEKIEYAFAGWETTDGNSTDVTNMNAAQLIALITSGDTLELQAKWIDGKRTVVYNTGLLVLNELPENRKTDTTIAVYAAMKDDGSNYRFNTWDGKPWIAVKDSITSVEIGSSMQPTSTANWFYDLTECTSINLTNLDTSRVTTMEDMFRACSKLTTLDLTMFDTSNVTTMFEMFCYCSALTTVRFGSSFNTAKVTAMSGMFDTCVALTSLDVTNFNTSRVTSFYRMFKTCRALTTLDISSFDTSSVTADYAFPSMFAECSSLTTIYASSSFQTDNVTASEDMFAGCTVLVGGQGTTFNSINPTDHTYARIDGGPDSSTPGYFTQKP